MFATNVDNFYMFVYVNIKSKYNQVLAVQQLNDAPRKMGD